MPRVLGLRSPHAKVGRIVVFGRMLDKIRLQARGELPADYQENLGEVRPAIFDARCCRFLGVSYDDIRGRTLQGGCDEEILAWAHDRGIPRLDEDCLIWNRFITKLGWRDDRTEAVKMRVIEYGIQGPRPETNCELLDMDEGRPPGGTRSWEGPPLAVIIVMGVSACGKTTVGRQLAQELLWKFVEADDLHSAANVAKMSAGIPLDDRDRLPWLAAVRAAIDADLAKGAKAVVACSALKQSYRRVLAPDPGNLRFAHLKGDLALMKKRIESRSGHFMKESLLESQFETLEEPMDALVLDAAEAPPVLVNGIRKVLAPA